MSQSNRTGRKGGDGQPGVGEPAPAGAKTAKSLSDSYDTESAYATTDSEDGGQSRGRSKGRHRMDKRQRANCRHPRPPLVPPLHHLQKDEAEADVNQRAVTERKMRNGNKTPQSANTVPNTVAMVTRTQRQITSHMTNATSTPSTKDGGQSGYATSWKLSTRSGTNSSIDGVGIGTRRRLNSRAGF